MSGRLADITTIRFDMDDQRVGRVVRALRRRRGWRQLDLALAAGCSQNLVSLIERGHLDRLSLRMLRRLFAAVDATVLIELRWRGAAVERLMDDDHAALVGAVASLLRALGWLVEIEVTYSEFGERGSFDLLALHPATGALLVIEVKTDLPSAEATLRKLDEKTRLAGTVGAKRFGWHARVVSRLLVIPETSTQRRLIARHAALFDRALPARNVAVRRWLERPSGGLSGLWFFSTRDGQVDMCRAPGRDRVRKARALPPNPRFAA